MIEAFAKLKDELLEQKARLNFILKAFGALAIAASKEEAKDWEAFQAVTMAREILERMVQRTEETLDQHRCDSEMKFLEQELNKIDKKPAKPKLRQTD